MRANPRDASHRLRRFERRVALGLQSLKSSLAPTRVGLAGVSTTDKSEGQSCPVTRELRAGSENLRPVIRTPRVFCGNGTIVRWSSWLAHVSVRHPGGSRTRRM